VKPNGLPLPTGVSGPGVVLPLADLDEGLSAFEELKGLTEEGAQDPSQTHVRRVAARHPEDPRWWSLALEQSDEVRILGHHDRVRFAPRAEDVLVAGITQPELPHGNRIDPERLADPLGNPWTEMSVQPELQATSVGWSRRRLA